MGASNSGPDGKLLDAAKSGVLPKAQEAVTLGANIEGKDKEGNTALSLAVTNGYRLIIDWLINENGANVNTKNNVSSLGSNLVLFVDHSNRILMISCIGVSTSCSFCSSILSIFLSTTMQDGCTPLMYAASVGHIDILKFLIEKTADLELKNEDGFTAMHWAAYVGNLDSVKTLVEKGADLRAKNSEGKRPADLAETQEVKRFIKDAIDKKKKAEEAEKAAPPAQ